MGLEGGGSTPMEVCTAARRAAATARGDGSAISAGSRAVHELLAGLEALESASSPATWPTLALPAAPPSDRSGGWMISPGWTGTCSAVTWSLTAVRSVLAELGRERGERGLASPGYRLADDGRDCRRLGDRLGERELAGEPAGSIAPAYRLSMLGARPYVPAPPYVPVGEGNAGSGTAPS
jgi:hypothetical protein